MKKSNRKVNNFNVPWEWHSDKLSKIKYLTFNLIQLCNPQLKYYPYLIINICFLFETVTRSRSFSSTMFLKPNLTHTMVTIGFLWTIIYGSLFLDWFSCTKWAWTPQLFSISSRLGWESVGTWSRTRAIPWDEHSQIPFASFMVSVSNLFWWVYPLELLFPLLLELFLFNRSAMKQEVLFQYNHFRRQLRVWKLFA